MSTISLPNNYLILQLGLWKIIGNNVVTGTNVSIKNITKAKMVINDSEYIVSAVIFHHGNSVQSGQHTATMGKGNKWIEAYDNTIKESNWPRLSKDAYIFICKKL